MTRRIASRRDEVAGTSYFVRCGGPPAPAKTVVLVHGFVISSRYMVPLAERLARDFRVLAPDLPGFGKTDKPPRALSVPELADALARWMDAVGTGPLPLVGNSFGCQVIVDLALRWPDLVERAVLVGPTMDPRGSPLGQVGRLLADMPREKPSLWLLHVPDYFRAGLGRALRTYRHAIEDDLRPELPRVRAPVLVVRGERDPIVSPAWADEVAARVQDGRVTTIPGGPHALNYSRPDDLARAIRPFLLGEDATLALGQT